jgi:hypothetical protein
MSGTARAIAPTMAGAAAGFIPTALFTTFTVVAWRSRLRACKITSAALAGNSAAGTAARTSLNELAWGASFPKELPAARKATLNKILAIGFIDLSPIS